MMSARAWCKHMRQRFTTSLKCTPSLTHKTHDRLHESLGKNPECFDIWLQGLLARSLRLPGPLHLSPLVSLQPAETIIWTARSAPTLTSAPRARPDEHVDDQHHQSRRPLPPG